MLREKYIMLKCKKILCQLKMYANMIRVLSKGYLPISLLPLTKLQEILDEGKKPIQISNPV